MVPFRPLSAASSVLAAPLYPDDPGLYTYWHRSLRAYVIAAATGATLARGWPTVARALEVAEELHDELPDVGWDRLYTVHDLTVREARAAARVLYRHGAIDPERACPFADVLPHAHP
ncbi:hypothetical protein [Streptomyces sp. URMC 129]|uniref:hypothetical protein n=1 Tax=Streptomyces sp. URMC 129 TaxID=3423407 RepID=UPI003F1AD636